MSVTLRSGRSARGTLGGSPGWGEAAQDSTCVTFVVEKIEFRCLKIMRLSLFSAALGHFLAFSMRHGMKPFLLSIIHCLSLIVLVLPFEAADHDNTVDSITIIT